jgi:hypothetical protein
MLGGRQQGQAADLPRMESVSVEMALMSSLGPLSCFMPPAGALGGCVMALSALATGLK